MFSRRLILFETLFLSASLVSCVDLQEKSSDREVYADEYELEYNTDEDRRLKETFAPEKLVDEILNDDTSSELERETFNYDSRSGILRTQNPLSDYVEDHFGRYSDENAVFNNNIMIDDQSDLEKSLNGTQSRRTLLLMSWLAHKMYKKRSHKKYSPKPRKHKRQPPSLPKPPKPPPPLWLAHKIYKKRSHKKYSRKPRKHKRQPPSPPKPPPPKPPKPPPPKPPPPPLPKPKPPPPPPKQESNRLPLPTPTKLKKLSPPPPLKSKQLPPSPLLGPKPFLPSQKPKLQPSLTKSGNPPSPLKKQLLPPSSALKLTTSITTTRKPPMITGKPGMFITPQPLKELNSPRKKSTILRRTPKQKSLIVPTKLKKLPPPPLPKPKPPSPLIEPKPFLPSQKPKLQPSLTKSENPPSPLKKQLLPPSSALKLTTSIITTRKPPMTTGKPEMFIIPQLPKELNSPRKKSTILKRTPKQKSLIIMKTLTDAHKIRDNILDSLGCLLQKPESTLTEEQYITLHLIFTELKSRPSNTQLLLYEMEQVPGSDRRNRFKSLLLALERLLPIHVSCAVQFWIQEIKNNQSILSQNDCLDNLKSIIDKTTDVSISDQEIMKPFDASTTATYKILGPLFVTILYDIQSQNLILTQEMFGIILKHFPIIPFDPVMNENIEYISKITSVGKIPMWQRIRIDAVPGEPYKFIKFIISEIMVIPDVPRPISDALSYVLMHLKPVSSAHANPNYLIMQQINRPELDIELLFSSIISEPSAPHLVCLKNRLLVYFRENNFNASSIFAETDRLRYSNPYDLLLAFLIKFQKHIPNQSSDTKRTVNAFLSSLLLDEYNKNFNPNSSEIEISSLFGYIDNPDFGPKAHGIYVKIMAFLVTKPELQYRMNQLIPSGKGKCIVPDVCLKETLSKLDFNTIPRRLEILINDLDAIIPLNPNHSGCRSSLLSNYTVVKTKTHGVRDSESSRTYTSTHLLPMMTPTQEIIIHMDVNGIPSTESTQFHNFPGHQKVIIPPIAVILEPPESNDIFKTIEGKFKEGSLIPIIEKIGSGDLNLILKTEVNILRSDGRYPTTGSLLMTLLERAKWNPKIKNNPELLLTIENYQSGLNLVAIIALPVVMTAAHLSPVNGILYSVIDPSQPQNTIITDIPFTTIPVGMLLFAIMDPNRLKEPVNSEDPYEGLLPDIDARSPGGMSVSQIKIYLRSHRMQELIPDLKPVTYPSRGFLLMVILQKLRITPEIASSRRLRKIITNYIQALVLPVFYTKVSYSELVKILGEQPRMKPDTANLVQLLPEPRNEKEREYHMRMQELLERQDLFDVLSILAPASGTSQKELLKMIILAVLESPGKFDMLTLRSCQYYESKILNIQRGFLPIAWKLRDVEVIKLKVHLGQLIDDVIDYDRLTDREKYAYNDLLGYLRENSGILGLIKNFPFQKFKTQGKFIRGFFRYLIDMSIVVKKAKNNMRILLPHVELTGAGAKKLETIQSSGERSGRRKFDPELEFEI